MRSFPRRVVATVALTSYLLAAVIAGSLHPHGLHGSCGVPCAASGETPEGGHSHHQHGSAAANHAHHGHSHHHASHAHSPAHSDALPLTPQSAGAPCQPAPCADDCTICRFLAQAADVVQTQPDVRQAELPEALIPHPLALFVAAQPTTIFSRGPPSVA